MTLQASDGFQAYLNHVYSLPILSAEQERDLFHRFQQENDLQAAHRIVMSHLRFVAFVARNYTGYGLPLEDLVQEGNIGLMKSVKHFDLSHGVRLATYAVHWIKAEITEYILKNWRLVKIAATKAQRKLFFNLRKLKQRTGWLNPTEAREVADYLNVRVEDVTEMESRLQQQDLAIDGGDGKTRDEDFNHHVATAGQLEAHSTDPIAGMIDSDHRQRTFHAVQAYLETRDERTRDIMTKRWLCEPGAKTNLKSLAEQYGVSLERIRQIESRTVRDLRRHLKDKGLYIEGSG